MGMKTVLATLIAAVTVLSGIAYTQQPPKPGEMTGLAFESLTVSSLEKSINHGPGTVQKKDGTRAVSVRDPDVGTFVELFEGK